MPTDTSTDDSVHKINPDDKNLSEVTSRDLAASGGPQQTQGQTPTTKLGALTTVSALNPPVKQLSDLDRIILINSIGGYTMNPPLDPAFNSNADPEKGAPKPPFPVYPTSGKKLRDGLFKTVVECRVSAQRRCKTTAFVYNLFIVLQLLLGATMTALAPSKDKSIAITVLAAMNTVTAGVIALLHNSGLPNRLQNDYNVYKKVEDYLMEIMNSGIVPAGYSVSDAVASCWDTYTQAKTTVENNKPANYVDAPITGKATGAGTAPTPPGPVLQGGAS